MQRISQITGSYCGPAVLVMLLDFNGITVDQEEVVRVSGVAPKIKSNGMTLEEMAIAIRAITQDYVFCFKRHASIKDLSLLVNTHKIPVGVEWQGIFDYETGDDDDDDDPGHYSVVTSINEKENKILIADPDRYYAGKDREFKIISFERRWWDINEVTNPVTKKTKQIDDYHALFVIVDKKTEFTKELGLKKA